MPAPAKPIGPTDRQMTHLRHAAGLLAGHFRPQAAEHLRSAGDAGAVALAALEAGGDTMDVHRLVRAAMGRP